MFDKFARFGLLGVAILFGLPSPLFAADQPAVKGPLWGKLCDKGPDGKSGVCYVVQTATAEPQNIRLLQIAIGYPDKTGQPHMILTLPLGVLLPGGVTMTVGDKKKVSVPIETCLPDGCRVTIAMDKSAFATITAAKEIKIRYFQLDRRPIDIPVKMEGLSKALKQLKK